VKKVKVSFDEDPRNYEFPIGFGSAFVEFTSTIEAKKARKCIHLLKYNGRLIETEFFDEDKFYENDFSEIEVIVIEKMG
jgi:RNA recognition motif-containing protein